MNVICLLDRLFDLYKDEWGINALDYKTRYIKMLKDVFKDREVEDVSTLELDDFIKSLEAKYSRGTLIKIKTILKQAFDIACRYGYLSHNPVDKMFYPRKKDEHKIDILTYNELLDFLKRLSTKELKYKVLTMLYIATGARRNEMLALKWKQIDFNDGTLINNETFVFKKDSKEFIRKSLKTNASCKYRLGNLLLAKLMVLRQENYRKFKKCSDEDYVFLSNDGRPCRPDSITHFYSKLTKNCSYHVNPHKFRHSIATYLMQEGFRIDEISAFLGHRNVSVTQKIYIHVDQFPENKGIADNINTKIFGDKNINSVTKNGIKNKDKKSADELEAMLDWIKGLFNS